MGIKLFLDDRRTPEEYGYSGWVWVKNIDDAKQLLMSGVVDEASFDNDLGLTECCEKCVTTDQDPDYICTCNCHTVLPDGYDLVKWLEYTYETGDGNYWPKNGIKVHSQNFVNVPKMKEIIAKHYKNLSDK